MSDLVGNPEDQFSHNEAHIFSGERCGQSESTFLKNRHSLDIVYENPITKCNEHAYAQLDKHLYNF